MPRKQQKHTTTGQQRRMARSQDEETVQCARSRRGQSRKIKYCAELQRRQARPEYARETAKWPRRGQRKHAAGLAKSAARHGSKMEIYYRPRRSKSRNAALVAHSPKMRGPKEKIGTANGHTEGKGTTQQEDSHSKGPGNRRVKHKIANPS